MERKKERPMTEKNPTEEPNRMKKVRRGRNGIETVDEVLAKWGEYYKSKVTQTGSSTGEGDAKKNSVVRKVTAKGSKKGCMKGKGGPENASCKYWGVRQRTWGKWVAEIHAPISGARLWLGTYATALEAALAYDTAARTMYGTNARVNLPPPNSSTTSTTGIAASSFTRITASLIQECQDVKVHPEAEEARDDDMNRIPESTIEDAFTELESEPKLQVPNFADDLEDLRAENIMFDVEELLGILDDTNPASTGGLSPCIDNDDF